MKHKKNENVIGITYGDPAGIGPEIAIKTIKNWKKYKFKFAPFVLDKKIYNNFSFTFGRPTKRSGLYAYKCLKEAVTLAKNKTLKALVTGPISKKVINITYKDFIGQTDEIAKMCDIKPNNVIMLFAANDFRIALFTRHISLKNVSSKITKSALKQYLILLDKELKKWFSIKRPKIAILGLNPHAGEGGLFGNEEQKIITPVMRQLQYKNLQLYGPLSPDATLAESGQNYLAGKKQKHDAYVSFYHDQSLPVFKAVTGKKGVNITLGLPFLRVSVDHGTAFDIAGKNIASNEGLVSAIKLVEKLLSD